MSVWGRKGEDKVRNGEKDLSVKGNLGRQEGKREEGRMGGNI